MLSQVATGQRPYQGTITVDAITHRGPDRLRQFVLAPSDHASILSCQRATKRGPTRPPYQVRSFSTWERITASITWITPLEVPMSVLTTFALSTLPFPFLTVNLSFPNPELSWRWKASRTSAPSPFRYDVVGEDLDQFRLILRLQQVFHSALRKLRKCLVRRCEDM